MDALARHRLLQMAGVPVAMYVPRQVEWRDDVDNDLDEEFEDDDLELEEEDDLDEGEEPEDDDLEDAEDEPDEGPSLEQVARQRTLEMLGIETRARSNPRPGRQVISAEGVKEYGLPLNSDILPGVRKLTAKAQQEFAGLTDEQRPAYFRLRQGGATHAHAFKTVTAHRAPVKAAPTKAAARPADSDAGRRILGAERQTLAKDLVKRYVSGESIQDLANSTGRSYGFIHRVLTESGVQLRQRGAARPKRATPAKAAPAKATPKKLTASEADALHMAVGLGGDGRVRLASDATKARLRAAGLVDEQDRITDAGRAAFEAHKWPESGLEAAGRLHALRNDPEGLRAAVGAMDKRQLQSVFAALRIPEPGMVAALGGQKQFRLPSRASDRADAPTLRAALLRNYAHDADDPATESRLRALADEIEAKPAKAAKAPAKKATPRAATATPTAGELSERQESYLFIAASENGLRVGASAEMHRIAEGLRDRGLIRQGRDNVWRATPEGRAELERLNAPAAKATPPSPYAKALAAGLSEDDAKAYAAWVESNPGKSVAAWKAARRKAEQGKRLGDMTRLSDEALAAAREQAPEVGYSTDSEAIARALAKFNAADLLRIADAFNITIPSSARNAEQRRGTIAFSAAQANRRHRGGI